MVEFFTAFLLPVFVVVVLPVSIVLITALTGKYKYNKKIAFFEKCVENGVEINPDLLGAEPKKTAGLKIKLLNNLMSGVIILLMGVGILIWSLTRNQINDLFILTSMMAISLGIGMLVWYFVGKKVLAEEIKAEQELLSQQVKKNK